MSEEAQLPTLFRTPNHSVDDILRRYPGCCFALSKSFSEHLASKILSLPPITAPSSKPNPLNDDPKPDPVRVLSIGFGTGLLEHYLSKALEDRSQYPPYTSWPEVCGVEVCADLVEVELDGSPCIVPKLPTQSSRYLHPAQCFYVPSTRTVLDERLALPDDYENVWLFVYPREVGLLERYLELWHRIGTNGSNGEMDDSAGRRLAKIVWLGPKLDWEEYNSLLKSSAFKQIEITQGRDVGMVDEEMMAIATIPCSSTIQIDKK